MRTVAVSTTFAYALMLEYERATLGLMTLEALAVRSTEGQTYLELLIMLPSMRIMAVRTGHLTIHNRVSMRKAHLSGHITMAVQTYSGRTAGIDNRPCFPAIIRMQAARAVTGLTTQSTRHAQTIRR